MRRVAAIILAAGASTRLGQPKQLVVIGTENLLERSVRVASQAACSPIVVVLGAYADFIQKRSRLSGVQVVVNHNWQDGMARSIRVGVKTLIESVKDVDGAVIMVCDMPAVTPSHLRALAESGDLTGSSYTGRRGVPAYLPQTLFSAIEKLEGDSGARELLRTAPSVELSGGELDIDTEKDVTAAQQKFGRLTSLEVSVAHVVAKTDA